MKGLTGFQRPQGGRQGGVRRLWLVSAADIASVSCSSGSCSEIRLVPGSRFTPYLFREDHARYKETIIAAGGIAKVRHELSFALPKFDAGSATAVDELLGTSPSGVIALAVTGGGDPLLIGWSGYFGTERPLKISRSVSDTGSSSADTAVRRVTLTCESISPAMKFTGTLPDD